MKFMQPGSATYQRYVELAMTKLSNEDLNRFTPDLNDFSENCEENESVQNLCAGKVKFPGAERHYALWLITNARSYYYIHEHDGVSRVELPHEQVDSAEVKKYLLIFRPYISIVSAGGYRSAFLVNGSIELTWDIWSTISQWSNMTKDLKSEER